MYKTITLRISKEDFEQIERLRENHIQKFDAPISQSQLIRDLIHEKYDQTETREIIEKDKKEELFLEKDSAHKRDLSIVSRLRKRKWGKVRQ